MPRLAHRLASTACEEALAPSALPQRLRDSATVYSLTGSGYVRSRDGDGPFPCIVERNHPQALIPRFVDAAGADTIIPALIYRSQRALEGATPEEILAEFETKASRGEFLAPPRPGVSNMTSEYNYIYLSQRQQIVDVHPHLMFYAPNLTSDGVGDSFEAALHENRGLPFVLEPGIHGYMISLVDHASDATGIRRACAGPVGDVPPIFARSRGGAAGARSVADSGGGHQH